MRSRPTRIVALLPLGLLIFAAPCLASDGLLGIYFDREGNACSGSVPTASFATLYVVFQPSGSSIGGVTGAEFRIDTSAANGFLFQSPAYDPFVVANLGNPFAGGVNVAGATCKTGNVVLMSFQAFNTGAGTRDATVRITAKEPPSNSGFPCTLMTLCGPEFTSICVDPGLARLNPSSPVPCSGRVDSEWTRVKELFR